MGEPKTLHFYDFEISGRVPEPQNQYDLSLDTPGYRNKSRFLKLLKKYYYTIGNQSQALINHFKPVMNKKTNQ